MIRAKASGAYNELLLVQELPPLVLTKRCCCVQKATLAEGSQAMNVFHRQEWRHLHA